MKKRILALGLILALISVLTGCIRYDITMKVNTNETVDIRALLAAYVPEDAEPGENDSGLMSQEEIDGLKEKGYTCEAYNEDGYAGCTLIKKGIEINAIGTDKENDETGLQDLMDNINIKVDGKHVTVDMSLLSEEDFEESSEVFGMLKNYGGYMNFNLEIPSKTTKHNATSVSKDGKTLTWDLTALQGTDRIYAEFDLTGGSALSWLLPVILGVAAVVVIAAVVIASKKKKNGIVQETVEEVKEEAHETAENVKEAVQETAEDAKEAVQETVEEVKETVREDVHNITDNE